MEIIRLTDENRKDALKRARDVLLKGGIVLYPTDTLYGLAVDAKNRRAIEALKALKGREKRKPISVIVPDVEDIGEHVELNTHARRLAARHLPGALTLVLPGKKHLPEELMLNGQIGVRVPDDGFARELARALTRPITATSANLAGHPTPALPMDIVVQFGPRADRIDLVIDAGARAGGVPSTVVTFIEEVPYIIREGAIGREELGI